MIETLRTTINEKLAGPPIATATSTQPIWDESRPMRAVVWNGAFDMKYVEKHARPMLTDPRDVIVKMTATTICGSDLHLYKGTFPGMKKGDIQGHEFMGIVDEVGSDVHKIKMGDRVVVAFSIACGYCEYCQRGEFTACESTNPSQVVEKQYADRPSAFYGYSHLTGGVPGGHAEYIRVPFADVNCFHVPDSIPDEKALYLTDIIPTALFAALCGEVKEGSTVGIWGLGPIGLMCARWCQVLGAAQIIGIDTVTDRLDLARTALGIQVFNHNDHPDNAPYIKELTGGRALDVGIECAGLDYTNSWLHRIEMAIGMETDTSEILAQIFRSVRKFGNVSIIGVYAGEANHFPIGMMMEKGFTVRGGQCPMQKYAKYCMEKVESGEIDPSFVVTHSGSLSDAPKFFRMMANKEDGIVKVFMRPAPVEKLEKTE